MAKQIKGKAPERPKKTDEQKLDDRQLVQNFLDRPATFPIPDFGQDDPAGPLVHRPQPTPGQHSFPGDQAVPDETIERGLQPWDTKELLEQLRGQYPNPQQLRNNQALTGPRTGPLINTPLPGHSGPLVNTPLPTKTGPLINMPLAGLPGGGLINTPPPSRTGPLINTGGKVTIQDLLKMKAQIQAQAHGYAHLIA